MRARLPSRRPGQPINAGRTRCPHFHFPPPPLPSHLARAPKRIKPAATDDSAGHRTLRTALDVGASRSVVRGGAASSHGQQEAVVVVPSGGVVLRGGRAVGGAIVVAPGGGPAAEQVPGGLREADGLHGLRDGPRGVALIHLLRRRRRHGEGAAGVPLLHHPAGAHGAQPGAVARPALRPPHRAPRRLQPPQRQRLALHQPAEPETGLAGLRPLRQRLQDHAIS